MGAGGRNWWQERVAGEAAGRGGLTGNVWHKPPRNVNRRAALGREVVEAVFNSKAPVHQP